MLEAAGFIVLGMKGSKSSHVRFICEYKGRKFLYSTSLNKVDSDARWQANQFGDIRNIKKAIDTGDATLMRKYLGQRE